MEEQTVKSRKKVKEEVAEVRINPLRNERIYIRFVPQPSPFAGNNPHHLASGGLMDGSKITLCVPMLRSGQYKNVLTDTEKDFLEEALGLDYNALSVYKRENNFWDNYTVELDGKEGLHLNLNDPEDYIKYKVLLANNDIVAPSVQDRIDRPKNTYRYEIVRETEETDLANAKMDATETAYFELGKIKDDVDTLRIVAELLDNHPYAANTGQAFLRARIGSNIQSNPKAALAQLTDPLLHAKMLIRRGTELGILSKRGDYYYLKSDNSPLCENGEDPTLTIAARFLNQHSHQDVKFILENGVSNNKGK